jgi:hypothetical protein
MPCINAHINLGLEGHPSHILHDQCPKVYHSTAQFCEEDSMKKKFTIAVYITQSDAVDTNITWFSLQPKHWA